MKFLRTILEIGRYINKFGKKKGLQIYFQIRRSKKEKISISLENITYPFNLRIGTSDIPTFRQIFFDREYDFNLNFTPEIIIDAGANIGLAAIYFANKYPKAKIISIEPERTNFSLLKENTKYYDNIVSLNKALSNFGNQELKVVDNGYGNWGFLTESGEKDADCSTKNLIKTVTVEDIMNKYKYEYIDVVKIDIEGYEKELFETNTHWLENTRCLIIELHDRIKHGCSTNFFSVITKYDFSFSHNGENLIFIN